MNKDRDNAVNAFTDKLNELMPLLENVDVEPLLALIKERLPEGPARKDPENTLRIVLQSMFTETLKEASRDEKNIFVASILDDLFSDEEKRATRDGANGLAELDVPLGFDGVEIVRMFKELKNGEETGSTVAVVLAGALTPALWGIALHDIAKNVANGAVENKLIKPEQHARVLKVIADVFRMEQKKPTDEARPYKPDLDS